MEEAGGQQAKRRPIMLLFPGGRSARIPFPRDLGDLQQRICKFAHGAIDPRHLKAFEKDAAGFYPQVDLEDFFDLFPDGGVTLFITNGEDFDENLFRKPGLSQGTPVSFSSSSSSATVPEPSSDLRSPLSARSASHSSGSLPAVPVSNERAAGAPLVVDEVQLTRLVDQLARNLNRGRDDFWLPSFGSADSVPWSVFIKGFCAHYQPLYERGLSKPESVQEEIKLLLEVQGAVSLASWQRFTSWFHPIEKVVQVVEDLRDRGLIYHRGFVGFRRQDEENQLAEEIMAGDHAPHGVLLRLSETYAHQHGIWLTLLQRRPERGAATRWALESCPLIYYKLFSGFSIPAYMGNQVFDSIDKLISHVAVHRASTMKEYVTKELREALRSTTRILPLRHYFYSLKRKEIEMREASRAQRHTAASLSEKLVQERLQLYGLQAQQAANSDAAVVGDGENDADHRLSLFVSVSLQIWGTVHNASYLRTKLVQWLQTQSPSTTLGEQGDGEVLLGELIETRDVGEYCQALDQRSPSGDVLLVAAIALVFQRPVVVITSVEGDRHVVQINPPGALTPRPVLVAHMWPHRYAPLAPLAIDPLRPWLIMAHELEEIEAIGRGAQASVYRGRYKGLPVAIKRVVLTDNADLTEHAFERELTLLQQLHCPALIQFLGACLESPPRLVFEFMSGGSLHDLLHNAAAFREALAADPRLLIHLALHIATGMQFLHASKITHCDLTPRNILLDEHRSKAKVADFGLARFLQAPGHFDQTGHFAYVAPEIWAAKTAAHFSYASDVFSFGMILWEMWARRVPYETQYAAHVGRTADVPRAYIADVTMGWRPALPSDVPPQWLELIQFCWHQDPTQRPTFAELISEEGPLHRIKRRSVVLPVASPSHAPLPANSAHDQARSPAVVSANGAAAAPRGDGGDDHEDEEAIQKLNLRDVY